MHVYPLLLVQYWLFVIFFSKHEGIAVNSLVFVWGPFHAVSVIMFSFVTNCTKTTESNIKSAIPPADVSITEVHAEEFKVDPNALDVN